VRGPSVARGYFGKTEASRATFGARIRANEPEHEHEHEHGWLRTGDLGELVDGELYVTGRLKDIAVVKGRKHAAEDVEHTVASVRTRTLRAGGCAVFSCDDGTQEDLVVVQEIERGADAPWIELAEQIACVVAEEHGIRADVVSLVRAGEIPRTTSGKVRRGLCRELFERGALDEVYCHRHGPAR
jgi:fatty acid CoA ligase FadD32